jgi:hypothetical protein
MSKRQMKRLQKMERQVPLPCLRASCWLLLLLLQLPLLLLLQLPDVKMCAVGCLQARGKQEGKESSRKGAEAESTRAETSRDRQDAGWNDRGGARAVAPAAEGVCAPAAMLDVKRDSSPHPQHVKQVYHALYSMVCF